MRDKIISVVGVVVCCLVIFFYFLSKNDNTTKFTEEIIPQPVQQTSVDTKLSVNKTDNTKMDYQIKPKIILFYTKWCSSCQKFVPILDELEPFYKNNFEFVRLDIDDPENSVIAQRYMVDSIPKIFYVNDKYNIKIEINHYISVEEMKKEFNYYKDYI